MRTRSLLTTCAAVAITTATVLVSCQKSTDLKPTSSAAGATSDETVRNFASQRAILQVEEAEQLAFALDPQMITAMAPPTLGCTPDITYDNPPGIYPRTVTVDWGPGCTQTSSGLTRSGIVMTTYYGDMADTGSYYIQSYDNYFVNGYKYEGELKMAHNSKRNDPQLAYRETKLNQKIISTNGDYTIYHGFRRLQKKEDDGMYPGTPRRFGWFRITGVTTGDVMESGVARQWRDSIDKADPLIFKFCDFISKGKELITFSNHSDWIVDYGLVNECDDQATITQDGVTTPVTLPLMR